MPIGRGDDDIELRIEPVDPFEARLDPSPFDTAPVSVPVLGRITPKDEYTEPALVETYYAADSEPFPFTGRR